MRQFPPGFFLPLKLCLLAGSLVSAPILNAGAPPPERLWKSRCSECHGNVGEFAVKYLTVKGDQLQGRHHVERLRRFLGHHYPPQGQVDAMFEMLRARADTRESRYEASCSACHADVRGFAKASLELREDGLVFAREADRELREYLRSHQQLSRVDADFFTGVLTRSAWLVHRDLPEPAPEFGETPVLAAKPGAGATAKSVSEQSEPPKKEAAKAVKWSRDSWLSDH